MYFQVIFIASEANLYRRAWDREPNGTAWWRALVLLKSKCKFKRSAYRHTLLAWNDATITCRGWITIAGKPTASLVLCYLFTHVQNTDSLIRRTLTSAYGYVWQSQARACLIRRAFFVQQQREREEREKTSESSSRWQRQKEIVDSNKTPEHKISRTTTCPARCTRFIFLHSGQIENNFLTTDSVICWHSFDKLVDSVSCDVFHVQRRQRRQSQFS